MTPTLRQTAIVLASLPRIERDWILRRLPPARARELAAAIDEATTLGITVEGALIPGLIDRLERRAEPADARAFLQRADARALSLLLADEPAGLIARFIQSHPWAWREAFIAHFSGPQKRALIELLQRPAHAPASLLDDALIDRIAAALKAQGPVSQSAPPPRKSRLKAFARAFPMWPKTRAKAGQPR
ncbi:MAG: hypothetical protein RIR70_92 [Pseudomonadota bacterium]